MNCSLAPSKDLSPRGFNEVFMEIYDVNGNYINHHSCMGIGWDRTIPLELSSSSDRKMCDSSVRGSGIGTIKQVKVKIIWKQNSYHQLSFWSAQWDSWCGFLLAEQLRLVAEKFKLEITSNANELSDKDNKHKDVKKWDIHPRKSDNEKSISH